MNHITTLVMMSHHFQPLKDLIYTQCFAIEEISEIYYPIKAFHPPKHSHRGRSLQLLNTRRRPL